MATGADVSRGRLIVLEGIDGSGKSTQAARLAGAIGAVLTREPGATALGAELRELLLDREGARISLRTEALLMAADRAQHVDEMLRPMLDAGKWVVCDRFNGSTLAYQGSGRGLDTVELERLVQFAAGGIVPDLQVLLDVPVGVSRERTKASREDRLEHLGGSFLQAVRDGYLELASRDPSGWVVVDADADEGSVANRILEAVKLRFGPREVEDRVRSVGGDVQ